jgi:phytol kinase
MEDLIYVTYSFIFVFFIIGLSTFLQSKHILDDEGARKFVHISVSNWWFFVLFFNELFYALIAPVAFILLNYLSYKNNIFKALERSGKSDLGTVYFPISLLILVLFTFLVGVDKVYQFAAATGILVLGYGDGLAAVIGKKFGKKKLIHGKSLLGSSVMFIVSILVTITVLLIYQPALPLYVFILTVILVAITATLVELFTPKGLDNLTIPLAVTLLVTLLTFLP